MIESAHPLTFQVRSLNNAPLWHRSKETKQRGKILLVYVSHVCFMMLRSHGTSPTDPTNTPPPETQKEHRNARPSQSRSSASSRVRSRRKELRHQKLATHHQSFRILKHAICLAAHRGAEGSCAHVTGSLIRWPREEPESKNLCPQRFDGK